MIIAYIYVINIAYICNKYCMHMQKYCVYAIALRIYI